MRNDQGMVMGYFLMIVTSYVLCFICDMAYIIYVLYFNCHMIYHTLYVALVIHDMPYIHITYHIFFQKSQPTWPRSKSYIGIKRYVCVCVFVCVCVCVCVYYTLKNPKIPAYLAEIKEVDRY
jgi:hypothetical protein